MHSAYAARYLGSRRRLPFALLHVLWRGEKAGHLADPFFDPQLRDTAGRHVGLAAFCLDVRSARPAPNRQCKLRDEATRWRG